MNGGGIDLRLSVGPYKARQNAADQQQKHDDPIPPLRQPYHPQQSNEPRGRYSKVNRQCEISRAAHHEGGHPKPENVIVQRFSTQSRH